MKKGKFQKLLFRIRSRKSLPNIHLPPMAIPPPVTAVTDSEPEPDTEPGYSRQAKVEQGFAWLLLAIPSHRPP